MEFFALSICAVFGAHRGGEVLVGPGAVGAIIGTRHHVGKLALSRNVENIVVEKRFGSPALPIELRYKVNLKSFSHVNRVVLNERILYRAADIDAARTIVHADVVADDGPRVARAGLGLLVAIIADQEKAAVVVVAVVLLNNRVFAAPVGVKPFTIALPFCAVGLVVLDHGVVRAPRPDRYVAASRALIGVPTVLCSTTAPSVATTTIPSPPMS